MNRQELLENLMIRGYITKESFDSVEEIEHGIRVFQSSYGLESTGEFDELTIKKLSENYCGVADATLFENKMTKNAREEMSIKSKVETVLKYRIINFGPRIDEELQKRIFKSAFKVWANFFSNLSFVETNDEDVWFFIDWQPQEHFESGQLGHAGSDPRHISFNQDVIFSDDNEKDTHDLFSIAAHEVGHIIGLDHVLEEDNIMFSSVRKNQLLRFVRNAEFNQLKTSISVLRHDKGFFKNGVAGGVIEFNGLETAYIARNLDGNLYAFRFNGTTNRFMLESNTWKPGWSSDWVAICSAKLTGQNIDYFIGIRNYDGRIFAYENKNSLLTSFATSETTEKKWAKCVAGDFDGDGRDEIIGLTKDGRELHLFKYDGSSIVQIAEHIVTDTGNLADIASGNFDGSDRDSIMGVRNYLRNTISLFKFEEEELKKIVDHGNKTFQREWLKCVAGDFDRDGRDEIIALDKTTNTFLMYKYQLKQIGLIASNFRYEKNSEWADITAGDFDGDGRDEIMALRNFDSGIYLLRKQHSNIIEMAKNRLSVRGTNWAGIGTLKFGLGTSDRDKAVAVRNYDGNLHLFEYNPDTFSINWRGTA